jgi:tyrosine-protein phosphatase YwqE
MTISFLQRSITQKSISPKSSPLTVDVHAHLLPNLDNGPATIEESIGLLREMAADGIRKIITTPHIMGDFYRNNYDTIQVAKEQLVREVQKRSIPVSIEVAAEYYVDVSLVVLLENQSPLLTFGGKYLLFETSVVNMPSFLIETIKQIQNRGLVPVMAHPERYHYLQQDKKLIHQLHDMGVLFQVNISSLQSSHPLTKEMAEYLVMHKLVDFMGSNTHNRNEWVGTRQAMQSKYYQMALDGGILNQTLL